MKTKIGLNHPTTKKEGIHLDQQGQYPLLQRKKYFTDAIQPGGLYLLDEPENSLSAEMQIELVHFPHGMIRMYDCQFILSSHSPFILSLPGAKIYNMDSEPVTTCRWTDLPNVRLYYDFFIGHEAEF